MCEDLRYGRSESGPACVGGEEGSLELIHSRRFKHASVLFLDLLAFYILLLPVCTVVLTTVLCMPCECHIVALRINAESSIFCHEFLLDKKVFSPRAIAVYCRSGKVVLVLVLETLYKNVLFSPYTSTVKSNALQMAHLSTKSHCKKSSY